MEEIAGHSALLGQLLSALQSRDTGRVYVGPIYNGVVTRQYAADSDQAFARDDEAMAWDTFGFSGSTRLENGTLSLDLNLSGHPEFSEIHAQLTNAGASGTVRLVSRDGTSREANW